MSTDLAGQLLAQAKLSADYQRELLTDAAERIAQLEQQLAAAEQPIPEAYACERCGRRDGLDCVLPGADWALICGGWRILCLWCIDALCEEKGIRTTASIHFAGRSIIGTSQSAADSEHISRVCNELTAARRTIQALREALQRMLSQETDWEDGEIGVGHRFREIARAALAADGEQKQENH